MRKVLFICTGNYYRSRFAEALFNAQAETRGLPWRAFSRGFLPEWNPPGISPHTLRELEARRIPLRHTDQLQHLLTRQDLEAADLIIAVKEAEHRPLMRERFPDWESKITYWHVHDLDVFLPHEAFSGLEAHVLALLDELGRTAPPPPTTAQDSPVTPVRPVSASGPQLPA